MFQSLDLVISIPVIIIIIVIVSVNVTYFFKHFANDNSILNKEYDALSSSNQCRIYLHNVCRTPTWHIMNLFGFFVAFVGTPVLLLCCNNALNCSWLTKLLVIFLVQIVLLFLYANLWIRFDRSHIVTNMRNLPLS